MNTPQRQMLLDLKPEQVPRLDNFVAGANVELVERRRGLADARSFEAIYLWGSQACCKSHLLAATVESARTERLVGGQPCRRRGRRRTAVDAGLPAGDRRRRAS